MNITMDATSHSRFKGAESILNRSKSLYDGTKNTMRLSNIKSKLQTVSSSLAHSTPFSSMTKEPISLDLTASNKSIPTERDEAERRLRERAYLVSGGNSGHKLSEDRLNQKQSKSSKKRRRKRDKLLRTDGAEVKSTNDEDFSTSGTSVYPTENYEVQPGDTLTSVAARFDLTPSELCRINRLFCRNLFSGQLIKVPKSKTGENVEQKNDASSEHVSVKIENKTSASDPNEATSCDPTTYGSDAISVVQPTFIDNPTSSETASRRSCETTIAQEKLDRMERDNNSDDTEGSSVRSIDSSQAEDTSNPSDDHLLEENNPLAAQYLKVESEFVVNLQSNISGLLLITTDSLMFNPDDASTTDTDQYHLLLPLSQLRSIAAYADHSVMYFTKRDLQCNLKRRGHRADLRKGHSTSTSLVKITTDRSDPSLFTNEEVERSVDLERECNHPKTVSALRIKDADASAGIGRMTDSTHSVTFIDHLLPSHNLTQKSKSTDFTLANNCLVEGNKPACSLPNLNQPDSAVYLCVLANPTGSVRKRHPHWFTVQSMEYWFRIPEEKSEILFDFLLLCEFQEERCTETEAYSFSKDDGLVEESTAVVTESSVHGSKTSPANLFRSISSSAGGMSKPTGFVVVPNTFDWVLPRIGSIDEYSKLMFRRSQRRKRRAYSLRDSVTVPRSSTSSQDQSASNCGSQRETSSRDATEARLQAALSVPSLEEEKAALQILKQESVKWELVNASEVENELENARRREFILTCLQSATPERLPLPIATTQSAVLDANKVRDIMRNLPPEAEGLEWQLTYSTALHGFSLRTLYHRCAMTFAEEMAQSQTLVAASPLVPTSASGTSPFSANEPCLLVVQTANDEFFGAMLNTHPYASNGRFYGNGSCYVFRWISPASHSTRRVKLNPTLHTSRSPVIQGTEHEDQSGEVNPHSETNRTVLSADSPTHLDDTHDSRNSTSSALSEADSDAFIEPGQEVTEDFAKLFYLDDSDVNDPVEEEKGEKLRFQKYKWTGTNAFFIKGDHESISVGCSQGHSALYLDDVLLHGRTEACDTFGNDPLCDSGDFLVSNLEIWSFR